MKVLDEGIALVKQFEGFRADAYRDAVGVWTIGFGHTSMAGQPDVTPNLRVTREAATEILRRDLALFDKGVREALQVEVSDAQFSALVSFAYNVGLGNFKSSSVLKAVNRGDFDSVPRRLGLWNKAGGKVLPGLVNRRAAEAALFVSDAAPNVGFQPIDRPGGKPALQSKTLWSAAVAGLLACLQFWVKASISFTLVLLLGGILLALVIIAYERMKKSREEAL